MITASQLYDHVQCSHRPVLDATRPESERDEISSFIEMLWEQGVEHEAKVLETIGVTANLSAVPLDEREAATLDAMARKEPLIYRGRISADDLLGEPDLLELQPCGKYAPGDIKSGAGIEGGEEGEEKYKKHYAVQLGLYQDILERKRLSSLGRNCFVVNANNERVVYDLDRPRGKVATDTWWLFYLSALENLRENLANPCNSRAALGATCKLCHWYSSCKSSCIAANDLTMIPELGRSKRDVIARLIPTVKAMATCNIDNYVDGKKTVFRGIGISTLEKFQRRAQLLCKPDFGPYLKEAVSLPVRPNEVHFDIEADPMKNTFVYLHGMRERKFGDEASAKFIPFFADGDKPDDEEAVFHASWNYLTERIKDSVIYYYSRYERTAYRLLASKYPSVCSVDDVNALFACPEMVDLYTDVVKPKTEWPTLDFSIKTLAVYCGFKWRDTNPSGAASIEWYRRYLKTGDEAIRERILQYNEDDVIASTFVADRVRQLPVVSY